MNKKARNWMIVIGTGIAVGLSYYLFVLKGIGKSYVSPDGSDNANTGNTNAGQGSSGNVFDQTDCVKWPLAKGSGYASSGRSCEREYVKTVQKYLNLRRTTGMNMLSVDGYFGDMTENRLSEIMGYKTVSNAEFVKMQNYINQ